MPDVITFEAGLQDDNLWPVRALSKSMSWASRSCTMQRLLPLHIASGRSQSSLKTTMPASWPTAMRFEVRCAVMIQKRSFSLLKVWMPMRFVVSHTRIVRSSELDRISSFFGWNMTLDTLLKWPRSVSTSHAFESFIRQSLIKRSSAPDTMSGSVGWKAAQFTPRSWPSSTYFTTASEVPNTSLVPCDEGGPPPPMETVLSLRPEVSHTRTVWSREADTTRSSLGWKCAHIT
mmetsp:Transcript_35164/g.101266  ORF Transcript_35164/g.101266 Transcript_35164/m.101266 type:complete len:232 (-) Transcript_35164:518-1213(-)